MIQGWFNALMASGGIADEDTNSQGQQAFLFLGDSIIAGSNNTTGPGPTPTSGTAYQWDNISSIIEIGSDDVVTIQPGQGTLIPQFAIDYNAATGYKAVAICRGSGGAEFYPDGDNNNWYSSGTLRAGAESAVTSTLTALGITKLKAIVVILGINDVRSSNSTTDIETGIDSFVTWVTTTYPGIPVLFYQIGRETSSSFSLKQYTVRHKIISVCQSNTDCHLVGNIASYYGALIFGADNLHPTQTVNNFMGAGLARWFSNSSYSKWCRGYLSCLYGDITTQRKQLLDTFFTNQVANGNYFKLEYLGFYKVSNEYDYNIDATHLGFLLSGAPGTWTADTDLATNGVDQRYTFAHAMNINVLRQTTTDFVFAVRVRTATGSGSGLHYIFGHPSVTCGENASTPALSWRANNSSLKADTSPDTSIQANSVYAVARNGTLESLIKNTTVIDTRTSSAFVSNVFPFLGARNQSGGDSFFPGSYEYGFIGRYSDLDYNSLVSDLDTLVTNW